MELKYDDQNEATEVAGFIAKTFQILNDQQYSRIIHWSPSGTQFVIKDALKFQQVVLPKYFRHNKINSFIRQLNMYDFHKSRKDQTKSVFSHPLFKKNRQDLLPQIKRKIKQNQNIQKEKFDTPIKPKKQIKEQCQTTASGKTIFQTQQIIRNSLKQLNIFDNRNSSFKLLFENKQIFSRQSFNLNCSFNRFSQKFLGQFQKLDQKNDQQDMISIQNGIQNPFEREKQFIGLPSISKFQNPSMFFSSFILRN